jgi:hypothetical protein
VSGPDCARVRRLCGLAATIGALFGCDQTYTLRLSASVTDRGRPVAGAWIIALDGSSRRSGPLRTRADGRSEGEIVAFLRNPAMAPFVIGRSAAELTVVIPSRDFVASKRGVLSGVWETTMTVDLAARPAVLPLRCTEDRCESDADGNACALYRIGFTTSGVDSAPIASFGALRPREFRLPPPARDESVAVVALCSFGDTLRVFASGAL